LRHTANQISRFAAGIYRFIANGMKRDGAENRRHPMPYGAVRALGSLPSVALSSLTVWVV